MLDGNQPDTATAENHVLIITSKMIRHLKEKQIMGAEVF
jgi:hypothetical protein